MKRNPPDEIRDSKPPYFVGISGGSGSGKTTLLRRIVERFGAESLTLISQDNYYISLENIPRDLTGEVNFDHPDALDLDAMAHDLGKLQAGQSFQLLEYTFNNPAIVPKTLTFEPAPIVVIEGLFVFNHGAVNDLLDLKVFVDTSEHLRLSRRIRRDATERGYGLEEVLGYYEKFVVPMYRQHIEPYKTDCDIIIPNDRHMERATMLLIDHLAAVLARRNGQ
jgi:uridine kinase